MRATAFLFLIALISLLTFKAEAKEVQIIEIRKNLQLSNDETVFTDYYLNAGDDLGIKPGTTFVLYRRVNVIDRLGSNQGRALSIPVGKIRIIYVAKDLSVARLDTLEKNENTPILEHRGVMLGDLINVESAAMSADKTASYGPQGLGVSFAAQPIIPTIENYKVESRMPASVEESAKPATQNAKPANNVESIKSSVKPSDGAQVPLIR